MRVPKLRVLGFRQSERLGLGAGCKVREIGAFRAGGGGGAGECILGSPL